LRSYDQVIVSINDTRTRPASKLDYSNGVKIFIAQVAAHPHSVVCVFANPYTLAGLPGIESSSALIAGYQMSDEMQRSAVKVINRIIGSKGKLPVRVSTIFPYGTGVILK
jgi:hypothetical protein